MKKKALYYLKYFLSLKMLHLVFLVAVVVRFWGIRHGFPNIFNVDEPSFVRSVIGLRFSLDPNRFDWPHTHLYLHGAFYVLFYYFRGFLQLLNLQPVLQSVFPILWQDPVVFYFISRVINAVMAALTIYPVYFASKQLLNNNRLAFCSALLFSFIPYHVYDSHLALLDIGVAFWGSIALYFIFRLIKNPSYNNYALSGLFLGLSFGTKYNAIFLYIVLAVAVLYSIKYKNVKDYLLKLLSIQSFKKYFTNIVFFLFSYLFTNPTVVTDFDLFWSYEYGRGFLFQFENVGNKTWAEYPASLYENLVIQNMGDYGLVLFFILSLGFILYTFFCYRNKVTNLTLLLTLIMYLYVSKKDRNPSHYFVFLYPLISIYAVYFLHQVRNVVVNYTKNKHLKKNLFLILFTITIIPSVFASLKHSYIFARQDTRNLAANWLNQNLSSNDTVYFYRGELRQMHFDKFNYKELRRFEVANIDESRLPFYVFIGVNDLTYTELMEGDRDSEKVDGNVSRFLNNSELMFFEEPKNRLGPTVFIFKINEVETPR